MLATKLFRSRAITACKRFPTASPMSFLANGLMQEDPVKVVTYPGSRVVEFSRPESGNIVTENMLGTIKSKLQLYADLPTVSCVFFTSSSSDFFSNGLETRFLDEKVRRKQLLSAANEVAALIAKSDKETIAVFNGQVDSCVFGVLSASKYRLGTETTKFQVLDLFDGRLPLGGGIAHKLISTSPHGLALARYLAVSGRTLTAHDLYVLDLLTHIVQEDTPEDTLAMALAHTVSDDDAIKAVQRTVIHPGSVEQLLNSMHIYMGEVDLPRRSSGSSTRGEKFRSAAQIEREVIARHQAEKKGRAANQHKKFFMTKKVKDEIAAEVALEQARREDAAKLLERTRQEDAGELDVLAHPVWDRLLLVPTQELPLDAFFESEEARQRVEDLEDVVDEVGHCFSADTVAECRARVQAVADSGRAGAQVGDWVQENWAVRALAKWDTIQPAVVEEWFRFTKAAAGKTLSETYQLEEETA